MKFRGIWAATALAAALPAQAGIFDDEEARRQIADVRRQVEAQAKTLARIESEVTDKKALLELVNQIDALKTEIANLRGQLEVMANRTEGLDKRQKDLYVDLDTRLRKFEQARAETEKAQATAQASAQAEQQAYEAGSTSSRRTTTARRSRPCSRSSRAIRKASSRRRRSTGSATPTTRCATTRARSARSRS